MSTSSNNADLYPVDRRHALAAIIAAVVAVLVLAIAWTFQLIGGFTPCALCLEQREGYYTAIPLLMLAALAVALCWPACVTRGLLAVAGLMLATSFVSGVYQAGAEWQFWVGPNDCGTGGSLSVSAGSLLDAMNDTQILFCDEAALRVLGLSFAGWNVLSAGALALVCLLAAVWPPRLTTSSA